MIDAVQVLPVGEGLGGGLQDHADVGGEPHGARLPEDPDPDDDRQRGEQEDTQVGSAEHPAGRRRRHGHGERERDTERADDEHRITR